MAAEATVANPDYGTPASGREARRKRWVADFFRAGGACSKLLGGFLGCLLILSAASKAYDGEAIQQTLRYPIDQIRSVEAPQGTAVAAAVRLAGSGGDAIYAETCVYKL